MGMEDLGLINPSLAGGGNRGHGEDHFGEFLVQSKGELANEVELVLGSSFHGQVLEVGDVSLESVIGRAILLLEGSLSEGAVMRSIQKDSRELLLLDGRYSRRDRHPSSTVD